MHLEEVALAEIKELRYLVLWPHLASSEECVIDADHEPTTFQLAVKDHDKVVCVGTFLIDEKEEFSEKKQYRLRAMGTHPDYRGRGLGTKLIARAKNILAKKSVEILWCDARVEASEFYSKIGFSKLGGQYMVPDIGPHYLMYTVIE